MNSTYIEIKPDHLTKSQKFNEYFYFCYKFMKK